MIEGGLDVRKRVMACVLIAALVLLSSAVAPFTAGAADSVCRIGLTGYDTLGAALAAVQQGETIELLMDITHNAKIEASLCSFAVDLAGHRLDLSAASMYCLAATGGRQLSIVNSSPTESNLTILQTIAEADLSTAASYGALYTTGSGSEITIDSDVHTVITSNMKGADVSAGNSVEVGDGSITADRVGIDVHGAGSAIFIGNVTTPGSGAYGLDASTSGTIRVTGGVRSNGVGAIAQGRSSITVTGNVAIDPGGSYGAYANRGSTVTVSGSVTGRIRGAFAEGGTIAVGGDVSVTGTTIDCLGAYAVDTISPIADGVVTIHGSVSGNRYGAEAALGGSISVDGDATANGSSASLASAAAYAKDPASTVTVGGNATANGQNSSGVEVWGGGTATVTGNVNAAGTNCYGVKALSGTSGGTAYGSTATIDGTITATSYILIGATVKTSSDTTEPSTLAGYRMYSGAIPTCTVLVKEQNPQVAIPTASPIGGAVASGTTVSLSTTTDGASIHYTTDGSTPSAESAVYTEPISITGPLTIKAIATKAGMTDSGVMIETYTIAAPVATPTASPIGGAVASGTTVSLSTTTEGARIHYTTDGSTPSAASTLYGGPISITGATTIKAIAVKAGMTNSGVMAETYTVVPGHDTGTYVPVYHVITALAGTGGSISPSGRVAVEEYNSARFIIKPSAGYLIADVLVDGVSVGKVSEYTFPSVAATHTIEARFIHDCPSKRYADLDTSLWYHEGVDFVLSAGLFEGTSPDTFEPNAAMTRAMIATVLYRLDGKPATSAKSAFTDVPDGMWYTTAVAWGADEGVILGYGNGLFGPNDALTREQFVALFHRYAAHKGYDLSVGEDTNILSYNDAFSISEYAIPAMQWACGSGIVQGDDHGYLNPQAPVTRAEVAVMLLRFHNWSVRP